MDIENMSAKALKNYWRQYRMSGQSLRSFADQVITASRRSPYAADNTMAKEFAAWFDRKKRS